MNDFLIIILIIALSFLIGSIPTAIIISKTFFGFDIREKGSGNMGSTNAFRLLGWKWGITVQIIDILKGVAAVLLVGGLLGSEIKLGILTYHNEQILLRFIAGLSSVCGHIFSIFAKFKGGKGVNTTLGILLSLAPIDASLALSMFAVMVIFTGYISLGSLTGAISFPVSLFIRHYLIGIDIPGYQVLVYLSIGIAVLLILTHLKNIKRLINGTENKFEKLQLIKLF
jgi:acyl phosphate:glycerol-3-phosphate acyltransferase